MPNRGYVTHQRGWRMDKTGRGGIRELRERVGECARGAR